MPNPAQRQTNPYNTPVQVQLSPQTGMPPVYHKRSKEVKYDSLQGESTFLYNPWSPQLLAVSRPEFRW